MKEKQPSQTTFSFVYANSILQNKRYCFQKFLSFNYKLFPYFFLYVKRLCISIYFLLQMQMSSLIFSKIMNANDLICYFKTKKNIQKKMDED